MKASKKILIYSVVIAIIVGVGWLGTMLSIANKVERYVKHSMTETGVLAGKERLKHEWIDYKKGLWNARLISRLRSENALLQDNLGDIYLQTTIEYGPTFFEQDTLVFAKTRITTLLDPARTYAGETEKPEWLQTLLDAPEPVKAVGLLNFDNQFDYRVNIADVNMSVESPSIKGHWQQQDIELTGSAALGSASHVMDINLGLSQINIDGLDVAIKKSTVEMEVFHSQPMGVKVGQVEWLADEVDIAASESHQYMAQLTREHQWFEEGKTEGKVELILEPKNINTQSAIDIQSSLQYQNISLLGLLDLLNHDANIGRLRDQMDWVLQDDAGLPEGRTKLHALSDDIEHKVDEYDDIVMGDVLHESRSQLKFSLTANQHSETSGLDFYLASNQNTTESAEWLSRFNAHIDVSVQPSMLPDDFSDLLHQLSQQKVLKKRNDKYILQGHLDKKGILVNQQTMSAQKVIDELIDPVTLQLQAWFKNELPSINTAKTALHESKSLTH